MTQMKYFLYFAEAPKKILSHKEKKELKKKQSKDLHLCEECGLSLSSRDGLNKHRTLKHKMSQKTVCGGREKTTIFGSQAYREFKTKMTRASKFAFSSGKEGLSLEIGDFGYCSRHSMLAIRIVGL